jgi:hypothetical protein
MTIGRFWRTNIWNAVSGGHTVFAPKTPAEFLFKGTVQGIAGNYVAELKRGMEEGRELIPNTPGISERQWLSLNRANSALCEK